MSTAGQPPGHPARTYAAPFFVATLAALAVDAVLQLAIDALRLSAFGGGSPWWVTAQLPSRGRWVVLAGLMWWLAPRLDAIGATRAAGAVPPADAWRHVAIAVAAVPMLWILATWIVSAVRFTLLGSWESDGRAFGSPDYYRGLALDLTPWLMGAAAVMAVRRHVRE